MATEQLKEAVFEEDSRAFRFYACRQAVNAPQPIEEQGVQEQGVFSGLVSQAQSRFPVVGGETGIAQTGNPR